MLALDTETTGVDHFHGARPFFVTTCSENGEQQWWEWSVDPLTRRPKIPDADLREIGRLLKTVRGWGKFSEEVRDRHKLILQNGKFDAAALATVGLTDWPWAMVEDTLMAAHLLASNRPHDLTSLATQYLGVDIQPYEDALQDAVMKGRRMIQQARLRLRKGKSDDEPLAAWRIAEEGLPEMPSAKGGSKREARGGQSDRPWKMDTWLPRAMAAYLWETSESGKAWAAAKDEGDRLDATHMDGWEYSPEEVRRSPAVHEWWTVLRDYANADSAVTVALWKAMAAEIARRGLWAIYRERMKLLPVAADMERRGVTLSGARLDELAARYRDESDEAGELCVGIAAGLGHDIELPKNGVNGSLRTFCFDVLDLPRVYNPKAKTDAPTIDAKNAIPHWLSVLPARSKGLTFVRSLVRKRKRDTALSYLAGYRRFQVPLSDNGEWLVLHPSLNPTGTDHLRWSSSNPNAQNISKQEVECPECRGEGCDGCHGTGEDLASLRLCFGPAPGRDWWSFDAKNIELRLPAYESGERDLIDLFEHPDDPPYYGSEHLLNFSTIYPELWAAELPRQLKDRDHIKTKFRSTNYQFVKNFGFAVGYQAGDATADAAARRPGSRRLVIERFSKKEALNQKWVKFAEKHGYVETMPDRTVDPKKGYPILVARTEWGRVLPTTPLNYHVSGTAMWWMGKAMVRVHSFLQGLNAGESFAGRTWPGGYYITLQVHDELVLDAPSGADKEDPPWAYNLPVMREVKRLMELGGDDIGVPTPVSCEWHPESWARGESVN